MYKQTNVTVEILIKQHPILLQIKSNQIKSNQISNTFANKTFQDRYAQMQNHSRPQSPKLVNNTVKSRFSGDKTAPLAVSFHHAWAAILDVFKNFRSRSESETRS